MGKDSLRRALVALSLLAALPTLGCAAPSSYEGIPRTAGAADATLQDLARLAQAGDKHAQLELGIRYEEGRGLPVDLRRAERLYQMAARSGGGATLVYSPRVGSHPGGVVEASREPQTPGLAEAEARLGRLLAQRAGTSAAAAGPRQVEPDEEPPAPNAVTSELWRAVVSLSSHSDRESANAALRAAGAALEGSVWRFSRSTITCAQNPAEMDLPLSRAACERGVRQYEFYHFWDEELAAGGTPRLSPGRPGCLNAGEALNLLLRDWRPKNYSSPRIIADPRSPGTFIQIGGSTHITLEFVYHSQSGIQIYVSASSSTSCLANFYVNIP